MSQEDTNSYYSSSETLLGQLTVTMSMDDVHVLYTKEGILLSGINSDCELRGLISPSVKVRSLSVADSAEAIASCRRIAGR